MMEKRQTKHKYTHAKWTKHKKMNKMQMIMQMNINVHKKKKNENETLSNKYQRQ